MIVLFFKFFAMLQLRMKALLLVPFNTIYAQSCGDAVASLERESFKYSGRKQFFGGKCLKIDWAK